MRVFKKLWQWRQRASRNHVEAMGFYLLHPAVLYGHSRSYLFGNNLQELSLLGGGFEQGHRKIGPHGCYYQAGKAGTRA